MPSGIFTRKPFTEEHKRKISLAKLGKSIKKSPKGPMSEGHKRKISLANKDERNPRWRGDKVSYQALHNWVAGKLGRPCYCKSCGFEDKKHSRYFDWANISGKYQRDLGDWIRLCKKCHSDYDTKRGRRFTKESRKKMSLAKVGFVPWNKGKKKNETL